MENITLLRSTKGYAALQTRLALIDMVLNEHGFDKNLWSVYKPDSKMQDLHSLTGFNTFVDSVKKKVIEVETENGNKYSFLPTQKIKVWRGEYAKEGDGLEIGSKKPVEIKGSEIKETDEWYSYV
jgi:hypothetical protein